MATFYVLNNKKYRTSVRLRDGRLEAIRFEPEVYFGGIGQSTYTTSCLLYTSDAADEL